MRKHNFLIQIALLFLIGMPFSYAGTFTSLGNGGGAWTGGAATWTIVGDADGIPDPDDDVTIQAGDNITWNTTNKCRNLTINGTLTGSVSGAVIYVSGNYIVTGTEAGTGQLVFQGANKTITVTGTLGLNFPRWFFYGNTTILSPSVITKTVITINPNITVHNQGTVSITSATASAGAAWLNEAGSALTVSTTGFMSGRTFNASAANNTVTLKYTTGSVPLTVSGYYNLTIAGTTAGVKTLGAATTIANTLTINSTNTLSANGFDLTVGGNWTNNGIFTAGTNQVTLNGTGAQTIGGTASTSFYNLTKNASGTTTLARNTTVTNLLSISSGILDASTFGLSGAGGLTMTNGELRLAKTGATLPELTGAYSLTAGKVTFNGAGAQTIRGTVNYFDVDVTGSGTKTLGGILNVDGSLLISTSTLDASASSFDINLKGNWTNNGAFTAQSGTVNLIGTAAQSISGTSATAFENLTLNNTLGATILSGSYSLAGALTLSNGTFNTGGRTFTMTSTAAKTARIAPISGTGAVAGNFTVERFITSRDTTWADLASPVQNATFADWENELVYVYYGYTPPTDYPTQWTYDEAADDFSPVTSAGTALTPGLGFEVFLTGDFSYSNLPNTTINAVGVPNQGDQDLSALVTFNGAGSNLVGNPFASSISWTSVFTASSGIMNTYDMYDYTAGNYSTFGLGTEIGSGQGFWVYATSGSPTLIVNESAKTTSSNSSLKSSVKEQYFTLKLSGNDPGNTYYHVLKVLADNTSSDGWDLNDHPYRKSPNKLAPSMYTTIEGKKAVINAFNSSDDNYSMPVAVNAGIKGNYKIEAAGLENTADYSCIKLEDKVLNKMIDLTSGEGYSFQLNPDDNADRFVLHFSKSADCKSFAVGNKIVADLSSQIAVLPTSEGNSINFNLTEASPAKITVTNVLGQNIIEDMSVIAETQTVNVALPQDFSGMYIIKIESAKGVITKKYVRK